MSELNFKKLHSSNFKIFAWKVKGMIEDQKKEQRIKFQPEEKEEKEFFHPGKKSMFTFFVPQKRNWHMTQRAGVTSHRWLPKGNLD